jgi:hypothetical protein
VTYRVTILPRAKRQMLEQALWWSENRSAGPAFRWLEGREQALATLAHNPERCVIARESAAFDVGIRELHYRVCHKPTPRAVFEMRSDEVVVHSVRHLAQRDPMPEDIC